MTDAKAIDQLTLGTLRRLFHVDDDAPPYVLIDAATRARSTVPQLVLSVARRSGEPMGSGANDLLVRAKARTEDYLDLLGHVRRDVPQARVIKGASLGDLYPPDLLRPVGDIDLLVPTEEDVWRAAVANTQIRKVWDVQVVLHGSQALPFVTLRWDPVDIWLDRPMKAEIFCTPFMGNARAVGVRPWTGERDSVLVDLLAVCEERFQRPFNPKDAADVLVLADTQLPSPQQILAVADEHRLAPELVELLEYTAAVADIGALNEVLALAHAAAEAEKKRRDAWTRPPLDAALPHVVWRWLHQNVPVPSVLLRRTETAGPLRTELYPVGNHMLYRTPLGDFLLTVQELVSQADAQAAFDLLDTLDAAEPEG